ncbi:hypothetical protein DL767_009022 [Monosporascus sp. MG133]|nr:hypothetical protein DL767_009022 [Monosporascus sp. MG133]
MTKTETDAAVVSIAGRAIKGEQEEGNSGDEHLLAALSPPNQVKNADGRSVYSNVDGRSSLSRRIPPFPDALFSTPDAEALESFAVSLRPYQKQSLCWLRKEEDLKNEVCKASMRPLWEEYSRPAKDTDDKDMVHVEGQPKSGPTPAPLLLLTGTTKGGIGAETMISPAAASPAMITFWADPLRKAQLTVDVVKHSETPPVAPRRAPSPSPQTTTPGILCWPTGSGRGAANTAYDAEMHARLRTHEAPSGTHRPPFPSGYVCNALKHRFERLRKELTAEGHLVHPSLGICAYALHLGSVRTRLQNHAKALSSEWMA